MLRLARCSRTPWMNKKSCHHRRLMKGFRSVITLHLIVYLEIFKAENDVYFFLCSKDTSEADDPTVSYTGHQPVPVILSPNPQEDLIDSCVGPRNIPGVVALAEFLLTLKDCPAS